MALGALIIKARLRLTDEELVEQIKENPYLQFFIGLEGFQTSAPFDPSMIVYLRKRLPETVVKDCNERIVQHGLNLIRASETEDHDRAPLPQVEQERRHASLSTGNDVTHPSSAAVISAQRFGHGRGPD